MSLPPVWDPDAEPLDREIKLCLSTRQLEELDLLVKELNMSRSWILRGALGQGPAVVRRQRASAPRRRLRVQRGGQESGCGWSAPWSSFRRPACGSLGKSTGAA